MSKQSKRPARAARRQAPPVAAQNVNRKARSLAVGLLVAAAVAGLVAAATTLGSRGASASNRPIAVGQKVPAFAATNVLSGADVTSGQLTGKDVLYYFSGGLMCQSCLVQIQALQQSAEFEQRHLMLVSVTNDDAASLRQAAADYRITTTLLADPSRTMSDAFGVVGGIPHGAGMHSNFDDHTFVLVDTTGTVRFVHDYPTMWIPVEKLLEQLPKLS